MLADTLLLVIILLSAIVLFIFLIRRRNRNSLPVNDPDDSLTRLVRHLSDL